MPQASTPPNTQIKYAWKDHDSATLDLNPPVLNQWYTLFDEKDVRLLEMVIYQENTVTDAKQVEIKWTIDGNVYFTDPTVNNAAELWILRQYSASNLGSAGLTSSATRTQANNFTDKRGLDFKVEIRQISAIGLAQRLAAWAIFETLEAT